METEGWSLYCYRMPSPGPGRAQKTPEMDVSGRDKQNLKTGAPNFEKQKIESNLKMSVDVFFFQESVRRLPTSPLGKCDHVIRNSEVVKTH